jgi:hypothetical protein
MNSRSMKRGGGSGGQPLSWVDPNASEPSVSAGTNLLGIEGNIVRPRIGGFLPSVMGGVIQNGNYLLLPSVAAGKRLLDSIKTRKKRRGGGKMNDYRIDFEKAKRNLKALIPEGQKGAPAKNIQALVAVRRGTSKKYRSESEMMADFRERMEERKKGKIQPKAKMPEMPEMPEKDGERPMTRKEEWAAYKALATAHLKNVVNAPRQANVLKLAGILQKDQGEDADDYLEEVRKRVAKAVHLAKTPKTPGKRQMWEQQKQEAKRQLEELLSSPQRKEILALAKILQDGKDPSYFLSTVGAPKYATRKAPRKIQNKPNGRKIWGETLRTARSKLAERVNNPQKQNILEVARSLAAKKNVNTLINNIVSRKKEVRIRNTPNIRTMTPDSLNLDELRNRFAQRQE